MRHQCGLWKRSETRERAGMILWEWKLSLCVCLSVCMSPDTLSGYILPMLDQLAFSWAKQLHMAIKGIGVDT